MGYTRWLIYLYITLIKVDEVHGMLQHFTSMSLKKKTPSAGSSNISIAEISSLDIKDKLS